MTKSAYSPNIVKRRDLNLLHDCKGSPLAELALILPLMIILLFGLFDVAFVLYQKQLVTKGVQDAARFAARNTTLIENGNCPPSSAGWTTTVIQAQQIAVRGSSNGSIMLDNFSANDVSVSVACPAAGSLNTSNPVSGAIPVVTVTAQINANSLGILGFLGLNGLTLTAEHSEFGVGL